MHINVTRQDDDWWDVGPCGQEKMFPVLVSVSCGLLLVSTLNIGVVVVRKGLRSPNLTARLMGSLAGSDFLLNLIDTIATALLAAGNDCQNDITIHIFRMVHNITRNLSSFFLLSLCIERSYWLVSMLNGRGRHCPSSMSSITCLLGISTGFLNMPNWQRGETLCYKAISKLYLGWSLAGIHLCSLIVLALLLKRFSSKQNERTPSPSIARELGVCRSVAFMSLTNFVPLLVFLSLLGVFKFTSCVPYLFSISSYSLVSALRPVLLFSLSKKARGNLLLCLKCQSMGEAYETEAMSNQSPNQVGSAEQILPRPSARIGASFRASVIRCDLPAHGISISAQTVMGSRNNLHGDLAGSCTTLNIDQLSNTAPQQNQGQKDHQRQSQQQQQQQQPRLSLLSMRWKKDGQNNRMLPGELRASSETLHSVTSISSPFFEHRIDVRVNTPIDISSVDGEARSRRASSSPSPPKQSHLSSQQPLPEEQQQPQPQQQQRKKHRRLSKQTDGPICRRTLSSTVEGHRRRTTGPRMCAKAANTRSQSLPIICIQRDSPIPRHRESSATATSDNVLVERHELSPSYDSSSLSYSLNYLPPAPPGRLYVLEGPHLPGAIMTPPGLPRRFFTYIDKDHEMRSSTSSEVIDSPITPTQCASSVDLRFTASPLPPFGVDQRGGKTPNMSSSVDLHAEWSGVYIGTVGM